MSLEHLVINTLEELEVICKYKNSVRITYTNVFSHLRSRDRKLRIFSKPELNITSVISTIESLLLIKLLYGDTSSNSLWQEQLTLVSSLDRD